MASFIPVLTVVFQTLVLWQGTHHDALELRLTAEKATYTVYEPLRLKIEVINKGDEPVQGVFGCLTLDKQELELFYRKKAADFKRYYSVRVWWALSSDYSAQVTPLKPGAKVSRWETLHLDTHPGSKQPDRFVLDEPGEYEFKATFQYVMEDSSKVIESNVLSIRVIEAPEEEREALALWKNKEMALAVQDWEVQDADFSAKAINKALSFLEKFPNSLYTNSIQSALQQFLADLDKRAEQGRLTQKEEILYKLIRQKK